MRFKFLNGIVFTLLLVMGMTVAAQGTISYGTTLSATLDANTPQALYSFNGNAEEVITAYALSATEGFQPTLTILGPTGQIAFNSGDMLTPLANDARVTVKLPQAGAYSLLVGSASTTYGDYTLSLQQHPPVVSNVLGDAPVEIVVPPNAPAQTYSVALSPDSVSNLRIENPDGIAFAMTLSNENGEIVAQTQGQLPSIGVGLPNGDGMYQLQVSSIDSSATGTLRIVRDGASAPTAPTANNNAPNSNTPTTTVTDPNICAVFAAGNGTNLRTGPSTDYGIVATLTGDAYMTATGQYNGWYTGTYNGATVWAAASVTNAQGASCNSLPVVQPPPAPMNNTQPEQPTMAPTTEMNNNMQPTATQEMQNDQPTATPPPTENAGAPLDSDVLNWELPRDAGSQFNNSVSYPTGDTGDRVRITVADLFNQPPNNTREFAITLVCNGEGSENLRWGTGGPSSPANLQCGGSTSIFHTNDSNQTYLNINMTGDGYVNYTLIATPTS